MLPELLAAAVPSPACSQQPQHTALPGLCSEQRAAGKVTGAKESLESKQTRSPTLTLTSIKTQQKSKGHWAQLECRRI